MVAINLYLFSLPHLVYGGEGNYNVALTYARSRLSLDPLHEPAHRLIMQLYAANGQRAEALHHYQECVALLDTELATPPEEATTALYEVIKAGRALAKVRSSRR